MPDGKRAAPAQLRQGLSRETAPGFLAPVASVGLIVEMADP